MVIKSMPFTPEVMLSAPRRSAGVPNPSGSRVVFTTSTYSFRTHKKDSELRVLDVATGESDQVSHYDGISDMRWLNDDEFIYLQADANETTSIIVASTTRTSSTGNAFEAVHVAGTIAAPAANLKISQLDECGEAFAVVLSAECHSDGSLYIPAQDKKTHSTGRLYTQLFVRHWDQWQPKTKNTLWLGKLSRVGCNGKWRLSKLVNALKGLGLECPIRPFGGVDHFDVCKHGIIFVAKDPDLNPALNTTCNVYIIHISSGDIKQPPNVQQVVIPGFEGASTSPTFSSDGRMAAFLSMRHAGYESDKNEIFVLPAIFGGSVQALEPLRAFALASDDHGNWDRSPSAIMFTADCRNLLAVAEDYGVSKLFILRADLSEKAPYSLVMKGSVTDMQCLATGSVFISGTSIVDNSFYAIVAPVVSPPRRDQANSETVTLWNNSISRDGNKFGLSAKQVSWIWTPASNPKVRSEVASLVVKPSNFDADKTYPVAYLIHGGPQGSWENSWSTRWNLAIFAEQGYIVVAPNPTGSTGYGQSFTDAIRDNYGGDPYQDIVNVFNWVGANVCGADNDRAVVLGASYGGYMVNWIQGHDLGRKFKCMVCHDGITSSGGGLLSTEELYFPFHDLGGTPWYDPDYGLSAPTGTSFDRRHPFSASTFSNWQKWDPSEHFQNWSTPQLVIHSSKDYRLPVSEGLASFNVLQARGVESQFLNFPDENHWVLKPENSLVWHKVVLDWINSHVGLPRYSKEDAGSKEFMGGVRDEKYDVAIMSTQGQSST